MYNIILQERETKKQITEAVNTSGLPAFIIKPILKDIYEQLNTIEEQQYQEALNNIKEKGEKKDVN